MQTDGDYCYLTEHTYPHKKKMLLEEKQHVTFLACTNATGVQKVKLLVIGKAKNPRSFKNFDSPVDYNYSKSSWMTAAIFKHWFQHSFVPQVRKFLKDQGLPNKALLLIDNAPSHPPENELRSDDELITAMFMPPNVTPLIQPMDQNAIRLTKLFYRNSLLASIVATGTDVIEALKKLTLRDVIGYLDLAWQRLEKKTIAKCWTNILSSIEDEKDCDEDIPLATLRERICLPINSQQERAIELLHSINPEVSFSIADINEWTEDFPNSTETNEVLISDESESEDSNLERLHARIEPSEAINIFNKALEWAEDENISPTDISVLKCLREKAVFSNLQKRKSKKR
ncbi:jerky protein homolog-like [Bactrocera neohumeralis]|uniref:jerky protein homolog-like n=1 Tax=Bactrocera neohumeralis TaxID=98809 RepID=UPI002165D12E|nr:jerky protein homolog-like [Bactrocera neohumeralis]